MLFSAPFSHNTLAGQPQQRFEDHYVAQLEYERQRRPEEFQEVPGAYQCWQQLEADDRFVLGIATGGWRAPAQIKLGHIGLHPSPPYAAYADNMEQRDHILQAAIDLAKAEHQISSIIYVGDAIWDVKTTRQMELPLIGIRRTGDHDVLLREGVKVVLSDYRDVNAFYRAVDAVLA